MDSGWVVVGPPGTHCNLPWGLGLIQSRAAPRALLCLFLVWGHLKLNSSRTKTPWGEMEATQKKYLEAEYTAVEVTRQTPGHYSIIIYQGKLKLVREQSFP